MFEKTDEAMMNGQFKYTDNIELARHKTKISKTKRHNKT